MGTLLLGSVHEGVIRLQITSDVWESESGEYGICTSSESTKADWYLSRKRGKEWGGTLTLSRKHRFKWIFRTENTPKKFREWRENASIDSVTSIIRPYHSTCLFGTRIEERKEKTRTCSDYSNKRTWWWWWWWSRWIRCSSGILFEFITFNK